MRNNSLEAKRKEPNPTAEVQERLLSLSDALSGFGPVVEQKLQTGLGEWVKLGGILDRKKSIGKHPHDELEYG